MIPSVDSVKSAGRGEAKMAMRRVNQVLTVCFLVTATVICWKVWASPETLWWWAERGVITFGMIFAGLRFVRDDFFDRP